MFLAIGVGDRRARAAKAGLPRACRVLRTVQAQGAIGSNSNRQRNALAVRLAPGRAELVIVGPHLHARPSPAQHGDAAVGPVRLVVRVFEQPRKHVGLEIQAVSGKGFDIQLVRR